MADSTTVQIVISAKDQASKVFEGVGSAASTLAKTLAVGVAAGGAAVAAGFGVAIKSAADFSQQMSAVQAVSGASATEMQALTDKALELGAKTSFSASQAAEGLQELVKGGVSIPDIMNGAAEATLNLAAAGGVDLATAAAIASNALNTFNLSGTDMAHVSDMIAGAANASAIDVNDFQLSMAAAGAVTHLVGGSFDDLSVAITAMGNAGIKGSDAGTSLKTMLLNLQPQTKQQTALAKELGIITADGANAFFDATGKIKSFADVSQVLQTALKDQTEQEKLSTLSILFGSDAIRAAAVFAEQGAEGFNELTEKIKGISAADVAHTRLDNLNGDLEQLGGSLETAAIKFGLPFQGPLREAAQGLTKFINDSIIPFIDQYGPDFAKAVSDAAKGLAGGVGSFAENLKTGAGKALAEFGTALDDIGLKLAPWSAENKEAGSVVEKALVGVHDAALALQLYLAGDFKNGTDVGKKGIESLGEASTETAALIRDPLIKALGEANDSLGESKKTAGEMGAWENLANAGRNVSDAMKDIRDVLVGLDNALKPTTESSDGLKVALDPIAGLIVLITKDAEIWTGGAAAFAASLRLGGDAAGFLGQQLTAASGAIAGLKSAAIDFINGNFAGRIISIGADIGAGLARGIASNAQNNAVVNEGRNLGASAANAVADGAGTHSPSVLTFETGVDLGAGLEEGLAEAEPETVVAAYDFGAAVAGGIAAGLGKVKLSDAVDKLKGTVAGAMRDLGSEIDSIMSTTADKLAEIPEKAAKAMSIAIADASKAISEALNNANDKIGELLDTRNTSRALRDFRAAFDAGLSGDADARSAQRDAQDQARTRAQEDAKAQLDLTRELAKAKTNEERAALIDRFRDQQRAVVEQRKLEDDNAAYRKKRADEDRAYAADQAKKRQDFEDSLSDAALQKQINRTLLERDARIKSIGDALADKEKKIAEDAVKEQAKTAEDAAKRIQILRDEFVSKLPNLTGQAKVLVDIFLNGVDQSLLRVAQIANDVVKAIGAIPRTVTVKVNTEHIDDRGDNGVNGGDQFLGGPLMDKGGVVKGPSWVQVGPGVQEAFIPLNNNARLPSANQAVINLAIYGTVVTPRDLVDAIHDGLLAKKRGLGTLGLA